MTSTFPQIAKFTPAVLAAHCNQNNMTPDQLRVGTLRRVQCEIGNLLNPNTIDLHPDYRETWEDVMTAVRLALGEE